VYAGTIGADDLGLKKDRYQKLADIVTHVYHSAAQLSYSASYDRLKTVNVYGTLQMIQFCVDGKKTKLFCHVSTQGVITPDMFDKNGNVTEETPLGDINTFPSVGSCDQTHGYASSKWVAEVLVHKAAELGLPTKIFRLPQISGHSKTGFTPDNRNDLLVDFLKDSIKFRMVPQLHGTIVNISPVDFVSHIMMKAGLSSALYSDKNDESKKNLSVQRAKVYHVIVKDYNMQTEDMMDALHEYNVSLTKVNTWRNSIFKEYGTVDAKEISAMLWFCSYYQSQNESLDKHMIIGPEVLEYIEDFMKLNNKGAIYDMKYHLNTILRSLQAKGEIKFFSRKK